MQYVVFICTWPVQKNILWPIIHSYPPKLMDDPTGFVGIYFFFVRYYLPAYRNKFACFFNKNIFVSLIVHKKYLNIF